MTNKKKLIPGNDFGKIEVSYTDQINLLNNTCENWPGKYLSSFFSLLLFMLIILHVKKTLTGRIF